MESSFWRRIKNMNINVRKETIEDYRRVEEIARDAFWNLYFPGAHEHYVIHVMRDHEDFIKELAFVIEVDGKVEGAIFYTRSKVVCADGRVIETVSFGPVCISPEQHRKGLGRRLITHSIDVAKSMGYKGMLVLGYPYHYAPYGFVGGKKYGISAEDGNYYTGLLALPLKEGAFEDVHGHAVFSNVFDVSNEQVDIFDATFEHKEKAVLPCQAVFEKSVVELDD